MTAKLLSLPPTQLLQKKKRIMMMPMMTTKMLVLTIKPRTMIVVAAAAVFGIDFAVAAVPVAVDDHCRAVVSCVFSTMVLFGNFLNSAYITAVR